MPIFSARPVRLFFLCAAAVFGILLTGLTGPSRALGYDCAAPENRDEATTIELVLSKKWRSREEEVEQSLRAGNEATKVRIRFFPFLEPPANIGIGRCVSGERAVRAIRETLHFYGKLDHLIRQDILPHHWIKIGSTDTAELAWTPVTSEDLARLTDPALSNEQFHELYVELSSPKQRHRPFGLGPEKINK